MAFKMKGSTFYGKGNQSPLKISDEAVVAAQERLDHVELDFREPGWTKAARGLHEAAKGVLGKSVKKEKAADPTNKENITDPSSTTKHGPHKDGTELCDVSNCPGVN